MDNQTYEHMREMFRTWEPETKNWPRISTRRLPKPMTQETEHDHLCLKMIEEIDRNIRRLKGLRSVWEAELVKVGDHDCHLDNYAEGHCHHHGDREPS